MLYVRQWMGSTPRGSLVKERHNRTIVRKWSGLEPQVPSGLAQDDRSTKKETSVQLLQLLISGVAQGCIYGLIALGFVLIYKATETVSFAQGDLMMVGALSLIHISEPTRLQLISYAVFCLKKASN